MSSVRRLVTDPVEEPAGHSEPAECTSCAGGQSVPLVVVEPPHGWQALSVSELWHYRELLYFFAWRDVKVRYKQTAIGATWAILQPLLGMAAFSVIFGRLIGVPSDGIPYALFSYAALVPWTFFATALNRSGASLVAEAHVISRVYFPRLVVPISAVLATAVDFGVTFVILLCMLPLFGVVPGLPTLALPLIFIVLLVAVLGVGLWLCALNVKYRDVAHVIPFLTQFWLFVTPVAYPSSIIPEQWRLVYALNPMVGVIEGFRWALLGTPIPSIQVMIASTGTALALLIGGLVYFHRVEDEFADVV
jgi:lipopolysaccharide transport system permease protein